MRALALLVVVAALSGCAGSSPEFEYLEDAATLEESERREFEARLGRELAAGR